jgi:endonuclease YncB( thermonuclease family)
MFKITMWSLAVGAVVAAILGIHTGSLGTALIGLAVIVVLGYILFFLIQFALSAGAELLQIVGVIIVIVVFGLLAAWGLEKLWQKTHVVMRDIDMKTQEVAQTVKEKTIGVRDAAVGKTKNILNETLPQSAVETPEKTTEPAAPPADVDPVIIGSDKVQPSWWDRTKEWFDFSWMFGKPTKLAPGSTVMSPNTPAYDAPPKSVDTRGLTVENQKQISGIVSEVRSGYLIKIQASFIKLYGIDAPDPKQECLDAHGQTYSCGRTSKQMMEKLVLGKRLVCKVVGGDNTGNYVAACNLNGTDVGAGMVSAGWAVADRAASDVYIPYETLAHEQGYGLWAGKFVAPWDARKNGL